MARRTVPRITSTDATTEAVEVPTLTKLSEHHKPHAQFTTSPARLTAGAWINATAETMLAAKPAEERISVPIYKLQPTGDRYVVVVNRTVEKPIEVAPNNPSVFVKHQPDDGTLLDGFFSGEGDGAQLREADAIALLEAWANTENVRAVADPEARVNAARALTMRVAIRRGVVLHYGEAF
jgi:hypothetical protein